MTLNTLSELVYKSQRRSSESYRETRRADRSLAFRLCEHLQNTPQHILDWGRFDNASSFLTLPKQRDPSVGRYLGRFRRFPEQRTAFGVRRVCSPIHREPR